MKISSRTSKILFLGSLLLLLAIAFGYGMIAKNIRISKYAHEFPAYVVESPSLETRIPDFSEIVQGADAYILAEIVSTSRSTFDYVPEGNASEYEIYNKLITYGLDMTFPYNHAEVEIAKVLLNNDINKEIYQGSHIIISSPREFEAYNPVLKPGMEIAIRISIAEDGSKLPWKYAYSKYGFYYVVDDKYVMPGV